jgi:hypothetical protein
LQILRDGAHRSSLGEWIHSDAHLLDVASFARGRWDA